MSAAAAIRPSTVLTAEQVAGILGRSPRTLATWRSKVTGPEWVDVDGDVGYPLDDLAAWWATERPDEVMQVPCACGCGGIVKPGKRFLSGHGRRGLVTGVESTCQQCGIIFRRAKPQRFCSPLCARTAHSEARARGMSLPPLPRELDLQRNIEELRPYLTEEQVAVLLEVVQ